MPKPSDYCQECGYHLDDLREVNPTCPACAKDKTCPQDMVQAVRALLRTAAHAHTFNIKQFTATLDQLSSVELQSVDTKALQNTLEVQRGEQESLLIDIMASIEKMG